MLLLHNFYCVNPNFACATVGRTLSRLLDVLTLSFYAMGTKHPSMEN